MKPLYALYLICCCLSFTVQAQEIVVSGTVFNTGEAPVSRATVSVENKSATTNSKGEFTIVCPVLPNVLTVKHHSYRLKEEFINFPPPGQDTLFVVIHLEDKQTDLEEVIITSSRISWAYPKPNVHIIDFQLWNEGMLLLCKDHNEYLLRLVNEFNEPVVDLPIRKHPKSFFRDCMNGIHVYYTDSTFQVHISADSLSLFNGQTRKSAAETIESCVLSYGNIQLYQQYGSLHKTVDFVAIDTLSHQIMRLYYVSNRKYKRALDEFQREMQLQERSVVDPLADNSVDNQLKLHALLETQQKYLELLNHPVYAPAFKLKDSIVIFDHLNDSAVVFTKKGRRVRSYPIIYQHHKKWDSQLIINQEGTRIFARFDYQGMARLLEIDPQNGAVIGELKLEKHIYPVSIQCRGNYVYYIFHHYIDDSINYVYKQRID
ncbi:MAG: carboxypeptidase-like regulatory domain-containing protein [Fluviicola sp.]|nr:carboxypeptidase-like regulatory domain-containing protein [Fluviicola sp.]